MTFTVSKIVRPCTLLAAVILLLCACVKEDAEQPIHFTMEMQTVKSYAATVVIRHNGTNRDLYVGHLFEGHGLNADSVVAETVSANANQEYWEQKKRIVNLSRLRPDHDYTYVVCAVDAGGAYMGAYSAIQFHTANSVVSPQLNPKWKVTCKGQELFQGGYFTKISTSVSGAADERYIFNVFTRGEREQFDEEDDFLVYATEYYGYQYNDESDDYFWAESSKVYFTGMNFYRVLDPGQYVAYAIGVDVNGEPNGKYARSEYFDEIEYPMTPGFQNIVGTWRLKDAENKTFDIKIKKDVMNRSVVIENWGNLPWTFKAVYRQLDSTLVFYRQVVDSNCTVNIDGASVDVELSLYGWYYTSSTGHKPYMSNYFAVATPSSNGKIYTLESDVAYKHGLAFFFYGENGKLYWKTYSMATFPVTMTKL